MTTFDGRWTLQQSAKYLALSTITLRRLVLRGVLSDLRPKKDRRRAVRHYFDPVELRLYATGDYAGLRAHQARRRR